MPRGAQDLGNAIYAAHITWRQVGPLARYFNAYGGSALRPQPHFIGARSPTLVG